ncbi:hypothetical protein FACS1894163_03910 [Spirochaetia bacterium]|nr:hypothetical protein FACS1894163_03910 [Spirochaetia bacterium]
MLKNNEKEQLENAINNSSYFTLTGENMESARSAAKAKLVLNLWNYYKNRPAYPGKKDYGLYEEYGEELWKTIENSINSFNPSTGKIFLHYFNANYKRFLKYKIQYSHDKMTGTSMLLSLAGIQFIRKVQKYREVIEKSEKSLSPEQEIEWIANFLGCTAEKVMDSLKKEKALDPVSLDKPITDSAGNRNSDGNTKTLFDEFIDNDTGFHRAMPVPEKIFEAKEDQKEINYILDAMEYIFSQKTADSQKLLLKQVLTNEYADAIPPEAEYSFLDNDLLSRLKAGEKFTRREIAAAHYPEKGLNNAEASAKMVLDRFIEKVRRHREKKSAGNG